MNLRSNQTIGTGSAGGYTGTINMLQALTTAQTNWDGMRKVADVIKTDNGNALPFPLLNDVSQTGELLAEGGTYAPQAMTFGTKSIGAYKFSSKVVTVSSELIQDSALPIDQLVGNALGVRLGQIQSQYFTSGSGSGCPEGIVTNATAGVTCADDVNL